MLPLQETVDFILSRAKTPPKTALVLGSGLGGLAASMQVDAEIPYAEIPGFVTSTAVGHAGKLLLGSIGGQPCAVMSGRFHLYEGYTASQAAYPIYALAQAGVETLILTNAAGAINTQFKPGDLMLIQDHINLMGVTPINADYVAARGVHFADMSKAYTPELMAKAQRLGSELGIMLHQGVYIMFLGPQYETPAEIRMARAMGADAVGMSTVPEAIAASHCGMKLLGISCMTNMAAGVLDQPITHEEVLETGRRVQDKMIKLLGRLAAEV